MDRNAKVKRLAAMFADFQTLENTVRKSALNADALILLLWLRDHPRSSAGEASQALSFSKPKISRCLSNVLSLGLVQEQLSPGDSRKSNFQLTSRGDNVAFEVSRRLGIQKTGDVMEHYLLFRKARQSVMENHGLRLSDHQLRIIALVSASKRPLSVGDLVRTAALPQPSATMAIKALEGSGLVERCVDESDARLHLVSPTEEGSLIGKYVLANT